MKFRRPHRFQVSLLSLLIVSALLMADHASAVMITAAKDSHIRGDSATTNFGTGADNMNVLDVGSFARRGIMSFDLSSFTTDPDFIQFTSVQLQLGPPSQANPAGAHNVYRLHRDFVEAEVTWNEFSSSNSWQTAGALGALDSTQIATGVAPGTNSPTSWGGATGLDVTAAANTWVGAPDTTQLGFLVSYSTADGQNTATYGTKEGTAGPGPGPVLVIEAEFVAQVPEPGTGTLLGLASLAFIGYRRRLKTRH